MRRFLDRNGREWDAVVGRGSWGEYRIIFAPSKGSGQIKEVPLAATSFDQAILELDSLDDAALEAYLQRATPRRD